MNFKEESISINETISKLLESSDQDINVNIKQVEEVKEEKVEPKRMKRQENTMRNFEKIHSLKSL